MVWKSPGKVFIFSYPLMLGVLNHLFDKLQKKSIWLYISHCTHSKLYTVSTAHCVQAILISLPSSCCCARWGKQSIQYAQCIKWVQCVQIVQCVQCLQDIQSVQCLQDIQCAHSCVGCAVCTELCKMCSVQRWVGGLYCAVYFSVPCVVFSVQHNVHYLLCTAKDDTVWWDGICLVNRQCTKLRWFVRYVQTKIGDVYTAYGIPT